MSDPTSVKWGFPADTFITYRHVSPLSLKNPPWNHLILVCITSVHSRVLEGRKYGVSTATVWDWHRGHHSAWHIIGTQSISSTTIKYLPEYWSPSLYSLITFMCQKAYFLYNISSEFMKILNGVGSRKRTLIKRKSCRKWLTLITTSEIQSFDYLTLTLNLVCALSVRESYHLPH